MYELGLRAVYGKLKLAMQSERVRLEGPGCRYCGAKVLHETRLCDACDRLLAALEKKFGEPSRQPRPINPPAFTSMRGLTKSWERDQ